MINNELDLKEIWNPKRGFVYSRYGNKGYDKQRISF